MSDAAVWAAPEESAAPPPDPDHTLVVEGTGDPAVDLDGGYAVLPRPVRVEDGDEDEDRDDGEGTRE